jgi:hypothetical protein
MNKMNTSHWVQTLALCLLLAVSAAAQVQHEVTVSGTTFQLNGKLKIYW